MWRLVGWGVVVGLLAKLINLEVAVWLVERPTQYRPYAVPMPEVMRVEPSWAEVINERNLFNANPPMPPEPPDGLAVGVTRRGVTRVGPTAWVYAAGDEPERGQEGCGAQARIVPHPRGFLLIGIRAESLYELLGFRSGDVLRAINGEVLRTPNQALETYEQLHHDRSFVVEIERRRRVMHFTYQLAARYPR